MVNKIFVVEDDISICEMVDNYLVSEDFRVNVFHSGFEAIRAFQLNTDYALALIDLMLPDTSGMEVIKAIRQISKIPIIIITAKDNDTDKSMGLNLGADDYVVKPFLPRELLFRIQAILRRTYKEENPMLKLAFSQVDFERAEVIRQDKSIALTAKEFAILQTLGRNAGRIVTIDSLCEAAWGDNPYGYENTLMAHIRRIREKIEENPSKPASLITVKGLGYKLITKD